MSDVCYFCGDDSDVLERHHVVPRRHGGTDKAENLVTVCPTCHRKLEKLYGRRFYNRLGVHEDPSEQIIFTLAELQDIYWDRFPEYKHGGWDSDVPTFAEVIREYLSRHDHGPVTWCTACESATVYLQEEGEDPPRCSRCNTKARDDPPTATREEAIHWFDEVIR